MNTSVLNTDKRRIDIAVVVSNISNSALRAIHFTVERTSVLRAKFRGADKADMRVGGMLNLLKLAQEF